MALKSIDPSVAARSIRARAARRGWSRDFNSLDAQREACEAFIASQKHEGWQVLPELV